MTGVEQPVRVGDALERERLLHVDPEPALCYKFDEAPQGNRVRVDSDATETHARRFALGGPAADAAFIMLRESGITRACCPNAISTSNRSSTAISRASFRLTDSARADFPGMSDSATPRHNASASQTFARVAEKTEHRG